MNERSRVDGRPFDLDSLAHTRGDELLRLAFLVCGDRDLAQDLVQATLAAMLERPPEAIDDVLGYARRSIVNRFVDERRRSRRARDHLHVLAARETTASDVQAAEAEREVIRSALATLQPRERVAVVLRYYVDLDDAAIADHLGCRPATVRSLLARGRARMKKHFDQHPDTEERP